jgi:conjugal transfer pilus assembly protein TraB
MEEKRGLSSFIEKIRTQWEQLPTEQKSKYVKIGIALALIMIGILGYFLGNRGVERRVIMDQQQNRTQVIGLDTDLLQKTQYYEAQRQLEELRRELEELRREREAGGRELMDLMQREERRVERTPAIPPPPPPQYVPPPPPPPQVTPPPPPPPQPEIIGDIQVISLEKKEEVRETKADEVAKKKRIYLPPSFMEATLLSGLDAPAVGKGDAHPVPVLLRVQAPAVLPNKVKANLKGCFVIAEGVGNLASERADLRLVSLSCIDKKGRAVIDQKIKGFVVDSDGKIGLRGRVVSKMGAVLARSLISGIFGGLGQVISMHGTYYPYPYPYPPGGGGTMKPEDILRTTLAPGLMQATANLQKFYLDLAAQTIPVVEVQATRNVTIVISEGVYLEIKEVELL